MRLPLPHLYRESINVTEPEAGYENFELGPLKAYWFGVRIPVFVALWILEGKA